MSTNGTAFRKSCSAKIANWPTTSTSRGTKPPGKEPGSDPTSRGLAGVLKSTICMPPVYAAKYASELMTRTSFGLPLSVRVPMIRGVVGVLMSMMRAAADGESSATMA